MKLKASKISELIYVVVHIITEACNNMLFQSPHFEVDMLTSPEDILLNVYYMVLITLFYNKKTQICIYKEQMFPHCIN